MSLRAYPMRMSSLFKAGYNLLIMRHFDVMMRKWKGQKWIDYKNEKAMTDTHKNLKV